jgi:hypothetical protein
MLKYFLMSLILTTISLNLIFCSSNEHKSEIILNENENALKLSSNADKPIINLDKVQLFCNRLSEIKIIPNKEVTADDDVYDGLIKSGDVAIPCLIEKITDTSKMLDPREAPHIQDFRVGDAAVFMLNRITNEPLENILPNEYAKRWKSEGVYAYFSYVERSDNRKNIQEWWKNWTKKHLDVPAK